MRCGIRFVNYSYYETIEATFNRGSISKSHSAVSESQSFFSSLFCAYTASVAE